MKKSFACHDRANFVWLVIVPLLLIAPAASTIAAELKEAHVTRIIKDVQLLPSQAAPRPAVVNDNVRSGTAVRTGADSRTELTFTDLTLARLGANTIFSFNEGTRNLDLGGGAVLLHVPKGAGGAKITTAAVTAGITGTTVLMEYHRNAYIKFIVLEGTARMYLKNHLGESVLIGPGQMLIVKPNATSLPDPVTVDLKRLVQTCLLITEFAPLASQPLILQQIQIQQNNHDLIPTNLVIYGRGTLVSLVDPTNLNVISQETTAIPTPVPIPSELGPPSAISSPVPYVITSGTVITTDPTITTNGVTDFGKIWRGQAQDGPLSAFIFGSTSAFDTASGFDTELNGQNGSGGAVFKFTSLQLTGNPTISTPTGVINLGLIAVNGITSGGPGGTLTFAGIRGLLLATQDGSINLGPEIAFSGIHDINFYARGAGSNLTLGSAISGGTGIRLWAQGTIRINGDESATDFKAFSGGDFLAGTGTVTATDVSIQSLSNINIDASKFPDVPGGTIDLNAANTLNIAPNPGGTLTRQSLTGQATTINLQFSSPNTFDLGSAAVSFIAGSGGIQASNVIFANGTSLLLQATGDINIHGTQNGAGDTIFAGGAFSAQSDVSTKTLQAGTSITIGGSVSARDFVEAGTAINVGGELSALSVLAGTNITAGDVTVLNTTGTTSDGNVDISARNQISITNGVDINRKFAGASSGLNVLVTAGSDLSAGSSLMVNVDNSVNGNLNSGANIALNAGGSLTAGGDLDLTVMNEDGGHIGAGGNISVATGGALTANSIDAEVNNRNAGSINSSVNLTFDIGGALTGRNDATFGISNRNDGSGGGTIGSSASVSLTAGSVSVGGALTSFLSTNAGGSIAGNALNNLNVTRNLVVQGPILATIEDTGFNQINPIHFIAGGHIGGDATVTLRAQNITTSSTATGTPGIDTMALEASIYPNGSGTVGGSAIVNVLASQNISAPGTVFFTVANGNYMGTGGGTIRGDAEVNLSAANLSTGALFADIYNYGGARIGNGANGGSAVLNFGLTGAFTTTGDAQFLIDNSSGGTIGSDATVTVNAGSISTAGNFNETINNSTGGTIGGNATISASAASATTNGFFGASLTNDSGHIGGNAVISFGISGDINSTQNVGADLSNEQGHIGGNAAINCLSGNIDTQGRVQFEFLNGGSAIGLDATINISASNANISAANIGVSPALDVNIFNLNGSTIGGNATIDFSLTGDLTTGGNPQTAFSDISIDNNGTIGGNALINVNAANISTGGALDATIDNTGGTIGGSATINMHVSGSATIATDASFQILGNDPSGSAAITFNGGSYTVGSPGSGGMFFGSIDGNGTITFNNASVHADVIKAGVFGANGVLNIGGGTLTADTTLKLYAPGSNGQLNFTANVTLDGISAKILAANSVTIFNNVVVTIGDDISASVYTNHPNYTGFGGNGSTTGTFGGVGANQPLPLTQAPPFGPAPSRNGGTANTDGNAQTLSSTNVASSGRVEGSNVKTIGRKATGPAINVSSTDALLSLLDGAALGPGGKITIPASKSTSNSRNPSRINTAGHQKVDPGALDIRTASSLPARRLPQ